MDTAEITGAHIFRVVSLVETQTTTGDITVENHNIVMLMMANYGTLISTYLEKVLRNKREGGCMEE